MIDRRRSLDSDRRWSFNADCDCPHCRREARRRRTIGSVVPRKGTFDRHYLILLRQARRAWRAMFWRWEE